MQENLQIIDQRRGQHRALTIALILILLLAFALRIYDLANLSLWGDYAYSVYAARQDVITIARERVLDGHPPLYYYLLHFWMLLAGQRELPIRMLSVLIGVLVVPLTYVFGARYLSRRVGILGSLLVAISPGLVHYSRLPRMYILLVLLGTLSAYALARALERDRQTDWLKYFLATSLLIYTHYYGLALVMAEATYVLLFYRQRSRRLFHWAAATGALIVFYLPWVLFAAITAAGVTARIISNAPWPTDLQGIVEQYWIPFNVGDYLDVNIARPLTLAVFILWVVALVLQRQKLRLQPREAFLLVFAVILPIAGSLLIFIFMPYAVRPRFLIFCIPPYLVLLALVLTSNRRLVSSIGVLIVLAASAYAVVQVYQTEPYTVERDAISLTEHIEKEAQPQDAVVFHAFWQIGYFTTHYLGAAPSTYSLSDIPVESAEAILSRHPRVWLAMYKVGQRDPEYPLEEWLDRHWYKAEELQIGDTRLLSYVRPTQDGWRDAMYEFEAANGVPILRLTSVQLPESSVKPNGAVAVGLQWRSLALIKERYTISLQLIDSAGQRWAGNDMEPLGGSEPTAGWQEGRLVEDHMAIALPGDVAPGDYTLRVGLYPTGHPQPLAARGVDGSVTPQGVAIGRLHVDGYRAEDVKINHPLDKRFGDSVALLGYDLDTDFYRIGSTRTLVALTDNPIELIFPKRTYRAPDTVEITMYWQALHPIEKDYTVFIHLQDGNGKLSGQIDSQPVQGHYPTSRWISGQVVADKYRLRIGPDVRPGEYRLRAGMYLLSTMERVPVVSRSGSSDEVELQRVTIEGEPRI